MLAIAQEWLPPAEQGMPSQQFVADAQAITLVVPIAPDERGRSSRCRSAQVIAFGFFTPPAIERLVEHRRPMYIVEQLGARRVAAVRITVPHPCRRFGFAAPPPRRLNAVPRVSRSWCAAAHALHSARIPRACVNFAERMPSRFLPIRKLLSPSSTVATRIPVRRFQAPVSDFRSRWCAAAALRPGFRGKCSLVTAAAHHEPIG